jgi:hypothetical protein
MAPGRVSVTQFNAVLAGLGIEVLKPEEWAPLAA